MSRFIDDVASDEDGSDDSDDDNADDTFETDKRIDNKNHIHDEDYVRKNSKKMKASIESSEHNAELTSHNDFTYNEYVEKTVLDKVLILPSLPFAPLLRMEVDLDTTTYAECDELVFNSLTLYLLN